MRYQLILITRGYRIEQERKISQAGVSQFFRTVIILQNKSRSEMKNVFDQIQTESERAIVIGNSIRHDIIPATQNNAYAIWLNHPENIHGRNGALPNEACEVSGWEIIYEILKTQ